MEPLVGKVLGVQERASYFLENLRVSSSPLFFLDIIIVAILLYWTYVFLKETRAMRILYGFIFFVALLALGSLLNLVLLNWILKSLMTMLVVAIPIVFQPELRSVLERVGRPKFFSDGVFTKESELTVLDEIIAAVKKLSEQKIGALMILQRRTGLREYAENGVELDAKVSAQALMSIFFPRSPLHDGAVIIAGDRILASRSTLPVAESIQGPYLGMRHKAGVGVTENSDAVSVIISEETGQVSLAVGGKLERRISEERLKNRLVGLMRAGRGRN